MKTKLSVLLVTALMLLAGCSKDAQVVETIPADATPVAHLNVDKFFDATGGEDSRAMAMLASVTGLDSKSAAADLAAAVDLEAVYLFQRRLPASVVVTMPVKDAKKLDGLLSAAGADKSSTGGYDCYATGSNGSTLLVKGGQCWMVFESADRAVTMVNDALEAAAKKSIADVEGALGALEGDDLMNIYSDTPDHVAMAVKVNVDGNKLTGDCKLTGNKERIDSIVKSSLFVRIGDHELVAPEKPLFLLAAGFNQGFDWVKGIEAVTTQVGFDYAAVIKSFQPICEQLDGPAIVWAVSNASVAEIMESPYQALSGRLEAKVKAGGVEVLKDYFAAMLSSMGMSGRNTGDRLVYTGGPMSLTIGGVANRFDMTLGNTPGLEMKNYGPEFKDCSAVLMINVPSLEGLLAGGKSFGLSVDIRVKDDKATFSLSFPGSKENVLTTLMSL